MAIVTSEQVKPYDIQRNIEDFSLILVEALKALDRDFDNHPDEFQNQIGLKK